MFLENDDIRLSSRLTPAYKWGVTSIIILMNVGLWVLTIFIFPKRYWDLYMVLIPFCLVVSGLLLVLFYSLKEAIIRNESLVVLERIGDSYIALEQIVDVKRFIFYFFRIKYFKNENQISSILIMPRVREFAPSFGLGKIKSFKKLEERMNKSKR